MIDTNQPQKRRGSRAEVGTRFDASRCDTAPREIGPDRNGSAAQASKNPARNAPLEHSVRLGTMTGPLAAPLAQLAEQLTLNQGAALKNAEEIGTSPESAAPGAAVGAEKECAAGDVTRRGTGQGTAPAAVDDAELAEVLDRWATLPEAIRRGVMALVRSVG